MRPLGWLLLVALFAPPPAQARWAEPHEARLRIERAVNRYQIAEDGSYEVLSDLYYEVLDDSGVEEASVATYQFNLKVAELEVLEARTETDGKRFDVPKSLIEIKPVASGTNAIQEIAQLKIHFPALKPKSKILLKVRNRNFKAQIPGYFGWASMLSDFSYANELRFEFESELPLFVETNDPGKKLEVSGSSGKKPYRLTIRAKEPIWKQVLDEPNAVLLPEDKVWAVVSTSEDWSRVFGPVAERVEKELEAPLPSLFEGIAAEAKREKTIELQLATAMQRLGDSIRYVMERLDSSRDVYPRPMQVVAETGFGDCKDYSTALAAILRRMGFDARVTFIGSSAVPTLPPPGRLASVLAFNHAIVWAKAGGKEYWLDPTSRKGFTGTFEENAGRKALVLATPPRLVQVPPVDPSGNEWRDEKTYRLKGKQGAEARITTRLTGLYALPFTGLALATPQNSVDYAVLSSLYPIGEVVSWKFEPYELMSRRYAPLTFKAALSVKDPTVRTTQGRGFYWDLGPVYQMLRSLTPTRVSAVDLGVTPGRQTSHCLLAGAKLRGSPIRCEVKSRWMDGRRRIAASPQGIRIEEAVTLKARIIPLVDLRSKDFARFQAALVSCFEPVAVLYR